MKKLVLFLVLILCFNTMIVLANEKVIEPYILPPLPYTYDALEPYIDKETMMLHHDKHHAAYVNNLNKALEKHPKYYKYSLRELLLKVDKLPKDIREAVRNNGGGHFNHSLFWIMMTPNSTKAPLGNLLKAIERDFGSFDNFKEQFKNAGLSRFGSGWVWLLKDKSGKLLIMTTSNQDIPNIAKYQPILLIDLWEHAYYLKYFNKRAEYIDNWWNVVNWETAEEFYNIKH